MIVTESPVAVSNLQILRALLVKDWRFFRAPVIALLVVSAGSYFIALAQIRPSDPHVFQMPFGEKVRTALVGGAMFATLLVSLIASAFGGTAIAGERSDRTADFLGLLPVTRSQIILSKFLVGILTIAGFAGFSVAVLAVLYWMDAGIINPYWHAMPHLAWWAGLTISFFGVGWLFSTCIKSGPISTCASVAVTAGVSVLIECNETERASHGHDVQIIHLALTMSAIGLSSLIVGTAYYLRRVEP